MLISNIIPETKTFSDLESFSYSVPEHLVDLINVGKIVKIPFGKRTIRGVVQEVINQELDKENQKFEIKSIKSVVMDFSLPNSYLETAKWIAKKYFCSLGEAISMFLPPDMKRPRKTEFKTASKDLRDITLNTEQSKIFLGIKKNISETPSKPILLHGVTGSGKTEIYLKLAKEILALGKQVILLVPEIMLTPQTIERFQAVFGDQVCLIHSNLSKSEKYEHYYDFYAGAKSIMIGPRSALLVPSQKLGLIIIDEEQEDSYKQEQTPRYHAVDLAEKIAELSGATLLLGTATPRTETYYKTQIGDYLIYELETRHNSSSLPATEIVDLRNEIKLGNFSQISEKLAAEIKKTLSEKRQILLFLNRRGSATFVSCRDCGHVITCPNCTVPMVCHILDNKQLLNCHHCGHSENSPGLCPKCGSFRIKFFGAGIDRIEKEIRELFPEARIIKIDSTTIRSKNDYEKFYKQFKNHEVDIVIGTQIIAKGLDIPNVDLVGIVSADTGLHLPNYKASEKSFQLITQVSGRSGRKDREGKTILQTYWPESFVVESAQKHDYKSFYQNEIEARKEHFYPPFSSIIRIVSENKSKEIAEKNIKEIAAKLKEKEINFTGPSSCFYKKLHSKYRLHIIIKIIKPKDAEILRVLSLDSPGLIFDIDPVNLL